MGEQAREQRSGLGQHGAIVAVKSIHTLIFALVSTCVLHVFWAGVRGRPDARAERRPEAGNCPGCRKPEGERGECPMARQRPEREELDRKAEKEIRRDRDVREARPERTEKPEHKAPPPRPERPAKRI